MRGYFGIGQLSASEKQDILNQHKSLYNGYQTMQPQVSNTQPLYVFDAVTKMAWLLIIKVKLKNTPTWESTNKLSKKKFVTNAVP